MLRDNHGIRYALCLRYCGPLQPFGRIRSLRCEANIYFSSLVLSVLLFLSFCLIATCSTNFGILVLFFPVGFRLAVNFRTTSLHLIFLLSYCLSLCCNLSALLTFQSSNDPLQNSNSRVPSSLSIVESRRGSSSPHAMTGVRIPPV